MKIGYARVSTEEQSLDLQFLALKSACCDAIYSDHGLSGSKFDRPGLQKTLTVATAGDTIVVWRLDRLGRSLSDLVELVKSLGKRGIQFASLTESIDTRSPTGLLTFHMMAALAEFERSLISERTRAGLAAARGRGAKIGRPKAISVEQLRQARNMLEKKSLEEVAGILKVGKRTLARYLAARPRLSHQTIDAAVFGEEHTCVRAFHMFEWLPGHLNPGSFDCDCAVCFPISVPDSVRRSLRKSDARRIGRQSRFDWERQQEATRSYQTEK